MDSVLAIEGLRHRLYDSERKQEFVVTVKDRIDIPAGGFAVILGPNACGKTTLLSILGLLREPTDLKNLGHFSMSVTAGDNVDTFDLRKEWSKPGRIHKLRRQYLGFALQSGELLPALTVWENIALPLYLNEYRSIECKSRVDALLTGFGLLKEGNASKLPRSRVNNISGGEYQRVALARAIAHRPAIIFVDEPTASLQRDTARKALGQLRNFQKESSGRSAVVMITHDETLAEEFADLLIIMKAINATSGEVTEIKKLNTMRQ